METKIKNGIKNSNVFLVIGTQSYFDDIPKDQVMYAKGLKKPFRVLLDLEAEAPLWFKNDVRDYKELRVDIKNIINDKSLSGVIKSFIKD